jgi:cellobiose phosphorylase
VFEFDPCIPSTWADFHITWRIGRTRYEIDVQNHDRRCRGVAAVTLDGAPVDARAIPIVNDGALHRVVATLGDPNAEQDAGRLAGTIHA